MFHRRKFIIFQIFEEIALLIISIKILNKLRLLKILVEEVSYFRVLDTVVVSFFFVLFRIFIEQVAYFGILDTFIDNLLNIFGHVFEDIF
jgi:hypothetical protein